MQSNPVRALDRRLQEDWARDTREEGGQGFRARGRARLVKSQFLLTYKHNNIDFFMDNRC